MAALLELQPNGLYCAAGDFYIDPWGPVGRALVTHAHADRARPGSRAYLTARPGEPLVRARIGPEAAIQAVEYGERLVLGDALVSFHPAGHILGSAQIRIEHRGEIWVFSGDYKLTPDPTCAPFEPVRCHTFVTEATFALPIFRWPSETETLAAIHSWWRASQQSGKTSLLYAHPLGEAQRVLASLDASIGPIQRHESIAQAGQPLVDAAGFQPGVSLVLAPPSLHNSPWSRQFSPASTGLVSGWMRIRGTRRRRALDRGFVLSSHADWPALLRAIDETGAETVWVTHGFGAPLVRWLQEHGRQALSIEARFEGDDA